MNRTFLITTYQQAADLAKKRNLILAEYGDGADYSVSDAYCYWNKTGRRYDQAELYIEYNFDREDESGRKTLAGTVNYAETL